MGEHNSVAKLRAWFPAEDVDAWGTDDYAKVVMKVMMAMGEEKESVLPRPGETVAFSPKPKTAALGYDRVWCPRLADHLVPDPIRFWGGTLADRCGSTAFLAVMEMAAPGSVTTRDPETGMHSANIRWSWRELVESFSTTHGTPAVAIYSSISKRDLDYQVGNHQTLIATISNLGLVDEGQLSWEQVTEFRKDQQARGKYRRLLHWLDKEMVGKPQAFIDDEVAEKLEGYEWALNKHGIESVLGTISEALDGKYLVGASSVTGSFTLAGHPTLGVLVGGALIAGRVTVKLAQAMLDLADAERGPDYEISWAYEVKKLTTRGRRP